MNQRPIALYQTLEDRGNPDQIEDNGPHKCKIPSAWLGEGYYFWDTHIELAHWWGRVAQNDNYIICRAEYIYDNDRVWDLHGDGNHRLEFRDAIEEFLKSSRINPSTLLVSHVITFIKKKGKFIYKAIRANGFNSETRIWDARFKHYLRFSTKEDKVVLDVCPPVQICFIDKSIIDLASYMVIYPDEYCNSDDMYV